MALVVCPTRDAALVPGRDSSTGCGACHGACCGDPGQPFFQPEPRFTTGLPRYPEPRSAGYDAGQFTPSRRAVALYSRKRPSITSEDSSRRVSRLSAVAAQPGADLLLG